MLDAVKAQHPMPLGQHIPTNEANMISCMFPIHPLARTNLPTFLNDNCVLCCEDFTASEKELIVKLHCNHVCHYTVRMTRFSLIPLLFHFTPKVSGKGHKRRASPGIFLCSFTRIN
jgi:hypothetical protein